MKVLISDYPESMMPHHDLEILVLKEMLGEELEIEVYRYADSKREEFVSKLRESDALLTAFIQIDRQLIESCPRLKIIGINATGYDNVDLDAATENNVAVSPVGEYCTWDVSEMALAYMFALNKNLKYFITDVEQEGHWNFAYAPITPRLQDQTVGIYGLGKIGSCTARKLKGLTKRVLAHDPYVSADKAEKLGVELVESEFLLKNSDVIINHMNLTETNQHFFDSRRFAAMERKPIFINLGRGLCVAEDDLVKALDSGQVRAAGLDVLSDETPQLLSHPLVGRDNVIITPHSAFYSTSSLEDLMTLSSRNIAYYLRGEKEKVFKLVNKI